LRGATAQSPWHERCLSDLTRSLSVGRQRGDAASNKSSLAISSKSIAPAGEERQPGLSRARQSGEAVLNEYQAEVIRRLFQAHYPQSRLQKTLRSVGCLALAAGQWPRLLQAMPPQRSRPHLRIPIAPIDILAPQAMVVNSVLVARERGPDNRAPAPRESEPHHPY
jgi:hypothetical protein